ncbi:MAG: hypothetical protein LBV12_03740 [Puniceicoccales bacterium]|nr:hypothetical protein [Puniceicoccales bacterium]
MLHVDCKISVVMKLIKTTVLSIITSIFLLTGAIQAQDIITKKIVPIPSKAEQEKVALMVQDVRAVLDIVGETGPATLDLGNGYIYVRESYETAPEMPMMLQNQGVGNGLPPPTDKWVITSYRRGEYVQSFSGIFVWSAYVTWGRGTERVTKTISDPCLYIIVDPLAVISGEGGWGAVEATTADAIGMILGYGAERFFDYVNPADDSWDLGVLNAMSSLSWEYDDQWTRLLQKIKWSKPNY